MDVEERRKARVGTVSGLALLAGGTAVAAVAGGAHTVFATILLGLLALGMGHALLTEIQRQARRRSPGGWAREDTVNTVLLAGWAGGALTGTLHPGLPGPVRLVGILLTVGYAVSWTYFVHERRRTITSPACAAAGDVVSAGVGETAADDVAPAVVADEADATPVPAEPS